MKWERAKADWTHVCPSPPPVSGVGYRSAGALHHDAMHVPGPGLRETEGQDLAGTGEAAAWLLP